MIETLANLSNGLMQLFALIAIGLVISLAALAEDARGSIASIKLAKRSKKLFGLWLLALSIFVVIQLSYLLEQPIQDSINANVIRSYLTQTAVGKSYLFQIICILLILLIPLKKLLAAYFVSALGIIAVIAPAFQSHGSTSGYHGLAIGALVIHIIALTFWVGGLFGIMQFEKDQFKFALPRFSILAFWSAITVVASGAATAWTRLDSIAAWQSKYGAIVILKIILSVILVGFGALHRRLLIKSDFPSSYRLVVGEILVMSLTVFIGSWLSNTAPPVREVKVSQALLITGLEMPAAPTFTNILLAYDPDGLMIGILVFAVALYIRGVIALARRGDKWPVGRTVAFAIGISAIDFATSGGLGVYSRFAFSNHMLAHMVLGMIAPIGIVLGAPITLALRTLPIGRSKNELGMRGTLVNLLHSKLVHKHHFGFDCRIFL